MDPAGPDVLARELQRAEDLHRAGRFRDALHAYEKLLIGRLQVAKPGQPALGTVAELLIVERLAHLAVLDGSSDAADALLDAAAALCRNAGNGYAAAYYTLMRALLALDDGRLADAQAHLGGLAVHIGELADIETTPAGLRDWEAQCRWPTGDASALAVLRSRLCLALGGLLAALGQYGAALHCLERGLLHTGPGGPELARSLRPQLELARATVLLEQGRLDEAQTALARGRALPEVAEHPGLLAQGMALTVRLALMNGRYGEALHGLEQLVSLAGRWGFDRARSLALLNLAQLRIFVNQTAAARTLIDDAARIAAGLRDTGIERRAAAMRLLAGARGRSLAEAVSIAPSVREMWQGADAAAPVAPAQAWPELPQARGFLEFFEDRALGLQWALGSGDLAAATHALADMERVFADGDSGLVAARLQVLRGVLAYYRAGPGDTAACADALAMLQDASSALRRAGLRPELWQVLRVQVWAGTRAGADAQRLQAWSDEAQALLESLCTSLSESERAIYLLNKWTADEEALAAEIDTLLRWRRAQAKQPAWRRPVAAWRTRLATARLLWRIDRHKALAGAGPLSSPAAAGDAAAPPSALACLRPWRRDEATLATLVLPDRTLIVAAHGLRLRVGVSAVTRVQWRDAVGQWHAQMQRAVADPEGAPAQAAAELDRLGEQLGHMLQLPALLASLPARVRQLRFVPDDVLHGLPHAALRVQGRCIVQDRSVVLDYATRPPAPVASHCKAALLVGVGRACGMYPALPGVRQEMEALPPALARMHWVATTLLDDAAGREPVLQALRGAGLLHIACHGEFDPARPGRSGLVLPGPDGGAERLELRELATLDLHGLRHAGLSACWSADNFVLPGRWVVSLPHTLRRAGAHSVLAWLWPAPDRYAAALTARFYELLADHPRALALQRVHAEALAGGYAELLQAGLRGLPLWAGLQLHGASGPLRAR
ncbi:hypothetical protein BurJ1DRAFT_3272 [Burkholderiales bacterium JOSHI_001]|nr:hypothetical protein BurJ1DRAFT_3272 [Burkholderiales bacterium JOSHI_001]